VSDRKVYPRETSLGSADRAFHLIAILRQRVSLQLDEMCIVNQPVENTVADVWMADLFVPARGPAYLIAILADLPEIAALGFRSSGSGQRSPAASARFK